MAPEEFAALLMALAGRHAPGVLEAVDGLEAGAPPPTLPRDFAAARVERGAQQAAAGAAPAATALPAEPHKES